MPIAEKPFSAFLTENADYLFETQNGRLNYADC